MKLSDSILLLMLAAIWGSSFIFMRASVDAFGPVALIALRIVIAALFMLVFTFKKRNYREFKQHWHVLLLVGFLNSAFPFTLLAYASISLTGGTVSILNAMTPVFTAWIAHLYLKDKMNMLQFFGMTLSIIGLIFLVWNKVSWNLTSWWPILAGITATLSYGVANNITKKYLANVSVMTSSTGSLLFAALFMSVLFQFFIPDFKTISAIDWLYAIILGVVCTAIAFIIYFKLVKNIGPMRTASVTFLIPIFSFIWGFLLLNEVVTIRMWIATAVILIGMGLVTGIISRKSLKQA